MKLLVVFVSVLVLVAHGNAAAYDEELAEYAVAAGQEADGVGPQSVIDDVLEPLVGFPQEPVAEGASEGDVDIPVVTRVCTNAVCANICWRLGFRYYACISFNVCRCRN